MNNKNNIKYHQDLDMFLGDEEYKKYCMRNKIGRYYYSRIRESSPHNTSEDHPNTTSQIGDYKSIFGYYPLGRLPSGSRGFGKGKYKHSKRINRYITIQEKRIEKAFVEKNYEKIVLIGLLLLKNSLSYQLILFNKVIPHGYRMFDIESIRLLLTKVANRCREGDMNLNLKRFYIIKNKLDTTRQGKVLTKDMVLRENEKLRPIGAPELDSRIISKSINDLTYVVFHDTFLDFQHGFRKDRGVGTALIKVKDDILANKNNLFIYEFDFQSYFNKVKPSGVYTSLYNNSTRLAELVAKILSKITYKYKRIEDEAELKVKGKTKLNGKRYEHIIREGLPQGLSMSPVLATLCLEITQPPRGLTMYADDGVIVDYDIENIRRGQAELDRYGIIVEPSKTGVTQEFKFLGVRFNLKDMTFEIEGNKYSLNHPKANEFFMKMKDIYKPKEPSKAGYGILEPRSYMNTYMVNNLSLGRKIIVIGYSLIYKEAKGGYRFFGPYGIYDVIGASSECIEILASKKKELNLRQIKKLSLVYKKFFDEHEEKKWNGRKYYGETMHEKCEDEIAYMEGIKDNSDVRGNFDPGAAFDNENLMHTLFRKKQYNSKKNQILRLESITF